MANLFNIDIDKIVLDNNEIALMQLNGIVVYERESFCIEYTVADTDKPLNKQESVAFGLSYYGLPRIYSRYGKDLIDSPYSDTDDVGEYSYNYSRVEIVKKDGTITSNLSTKCSEISKVKLWYPETTEAIRFLFAGEGFGSALKEITYCNMSNFVSANYMFHSCDWYLTSIKNVGKWCTKNLTDMSYMFSSGYSDYSSASNLTEIDLDDVDTSNATDMGCMFWNCDSLTTLDLFSFNTSKVTNMSWMFSECNSLQELDIRNFTITNGCSVDSMLKDCTSLHTLRLDNCDNTTIRKIINSSDFPVDNNGTIYCKGVNASGLVAPGNWVFDCIDGIIPEEPVIPEIPDKPLYVVGQFKNNATITEANVLVTSSHNSLSYMFNNCTSLISVNTEGWDTSNVITMYCMFYNCPALIELDLSSFNITNVDYIDYMFSGCTSLRRLYLNSFSKNAINKIIKSVGFPKNNHGTIYCKRASAEGITAPGNWTFSYID